MRTPLPIPGVGGAFPFVPVKGLEAKFGKDAFTAFASVLEKGFGVGARLI